MLLVVRQERQSADQTRVCAFYMLYLHSVVLVLHLPPAISTIILCGKAFLVTVWRSIRFLGSLRNWSASALASRRSFSIAIMRWICMTTKSSPIPIGVVLVNFVCFDCFVHTRKCVRLVFTYLTASLLVRYLERAERTGNLVVFWPSGERMAKSTIFRISGMGS